MAENWQRGGFGLYIHWPFCQAKCPYCDFNSHVWSNIDQQRWAQAFLAEIDRAAAETPDRILTSIFFGGGTPSLMQPDVVDQLITRATQHWRVVNDLEITLEANPTSVEAGRFLGYRAAGVNRVSMGIQALNDKDLKALGRLHTAKEARQAFDIARNTFDRISFDLIYARQDQSKEAWTSELREALSMAADHLSLYQLSIEEGTAFHDRFERGKLRGLPSEDLAADMYEITQKLTSDAGLNAYEISNHAVPGSESRHNLIYWRGGDYIGVGPGAHGRLSTGETRLATEAARAPGDWLRKVEYDGNGELERQVITQDDQATEYVMMGLRMREGIDLNHLKNLTSDDSISSNFNKLIDSGDLMVIDNKLAVRPENQIILNAIIRQILT